MLAVSHGDEAILSFGPANLDGAGILRLFLSMAGLVKLPVLAGVQCGTGHNGFWHRAIQSGGTEQGSKGG